MSDNKVDINLRLKEVRQQLGLASGEFAQKSNIDPRNYSSIETGKRNVGERVLRDICSAFPINFNWLLTGEGEMLKNGDTSVSIQTKREKGMIRYWVDIEATGSGVMVFGDSDTNRFIDLRIPEFRDCTDAVNLYGDSMFPRYKSGQIIILKKWNESYIDFGNVYMTVTKGGHRMIKVLKNVPNDNDQVLCVSYNVEYPPFPILKEDIIELYLVKGAIEKTTL